MFCSFFAKILRSQFAKENNQLHTPKMIGILNDSIVIKVVIKVEMLKGNLTNYRQMLSFIVLYILLFIINSNIVW